MGGACNVRARYHRPFPRPLPAKQPAGPLPWVSLPSNPEARLHHPPIHRPPETTEITKLEPTRASATVPQPLPPAEKPTDRNRDAHFWPSFNHVPQYSLAQLPSLAFAQADDLDLISEERDAVNPRFATLSPESLHELQSQMYADPGAPESAPVREELPQSPTISVPLKVRHHLLRAPSCSFLDRSRFTCRRPASLQMA